MKSLIMSSLPVSHVSHTSYHDTMSPMCPIPVSHVSLVLSSIRISQHEVQHEIIQHAGSLVPLAIFVFIWWSVKWSEAILNDAIVRNVPTITALIGAIMTGSAWIVDTSIRYVLFIFLLAFSLFVKWSTQY